jgi:CBS domain-containing protein
VLAIAAGQDLDATTAADLDSRDVVTCRPDTTVHYAAVLMMEHYGRHLLVRDHTGPVGMISARDLLEAYESSRVQRKAPVGPVSASGTGGRAWPRRTKASTPTPAVVLRRTSVRGPGKVVPTAKVTPDLGSFRDVGSDDVWDAQQMVEQSGHFNRHPLHRAAGPLVKVISPTPSSGAARIWESNPGMMPWCSATGWPQAGRRQNGSPMPGIRGWGWYWAANMLARVAGCWPNSTAGFPVLQPGAQAGSGAAVLGFAK